MNTARHIALTRPPSPRLAEGERTHLGREPIDIELARTQHERYCEVLRAAGEHVVTLDPLDEHPDGVFVEDTCIVLDELAVLPRMGATSRRPESASVAAALGAFREIVPLPDGTLDGGDVVHTPGTLYVGQTTRTDHAALKALAHLLVPYGVCVKAVPVRGALHLKSACSYLGEDTYLVNREWIDPERLGGGRLLDVPKSEPWGANVLALGNTLVVSAAYPETAELLTRAGFETVRLDVGELHKAEGALTCMSVRFRGPAGSG